MYSAIVKRKSPGGINVIFEMPTEIEQLIERERPLYGGIMRIDEYPQLRVLAPTMTYEGERWSAQRIQVDQLDQVTFSKIK